MVLDIKQSTRAYLLDVCRNEGSRTMLPMFIYNLCKERVVIIAHFRRTTVIERHAKSFYPVNSATLGTRSNHASHCSMSLLYAKYIKMY